MATRTRREAIIVDQPIDVLDTYRVAAGLSQRELWLRYFDLGGMRSALQVEAYVYGALTPTRFDYNLVALALNERMVELDRGRPVPYQD
jgi:hypothetical protein